MTKKTTDMIFEKKFTKSGDTFFQGIGDYTHMFLFKCRTKSPRERETWKLEIKTPKERF
jgi:hypothetical protein